MNGPAFIVTAACMFILSVPNPSRAQNLTDEDPCANPDTTSVAYRSLAAGNWGYGYDSLLTDIAKWSLSPYVRIDSIGATVQGRTLFRLTITDSLSQPLGGKRRIWIHARTHPQEVEGTRVTNEMIRLLLEEGEPGKTLRQTYVYSIVPMYNPDGVELGYPRQNANGIDLESNWNSPAPELEVQALRAQFGQFMASPEPIKVALNMHSSSKGKRYFVYHSPVGTSELYSSLEKKFIQFVQDRSPGRIQPWDYFVSWTLGTAQQYPESWFWNNHAEAVMALTYEDIYGWTGAGYDSTAMALLWGIDDYLNDPVTTAPSIGNSPLAYQLLQNYPNPFNGRTTIRFRMVRPGHVSLVVNDMLGREVVTLAEGYYGAGAHSVQLSSSDLASGTYLYRLRTNDGAISRVLTVLR